MLVVYSSSDVFPSDLSSDSSSTASDATVHLHRTLAPIFPVCTPRPLRRLQPLSSIPLSSRRGRPRCESSSSLPIPRFMHWGIPTGQAWTPAFRTPCAESRATTATRRSYAVHWPWPSKPSLPAAYPSSPTNPCTPTLARPPKSEEHTLQPQSINRNTYANFYVHNK